MLITRFSLTRSICSKSKWRTDTRVDHTTAVIVTIIMTWWCLRNLTDNYKNTRSGDARNVFPTRRIWSETSVRVVHYKYQGYPNYDTRLASRMQPSNSWSAPQRTVNNLKICIISRLKSGFRIFRFFTVKIS